MLKIIVKYGAICYYLNMVSVKAYAKLNLTLDILGVSGGFHMLDSLVCSVDLYDLIKLRKRKDGKINLEMHGLNTELMPVESNNAYRAAEAFKDRFQTGGADIAVYKNIPLAAGMGGSSADAAGVLRGMSKLYGVGSERELKELADSLGSDTGYMLTGGFARLKGRGERVEFLDIKEKLNLLALIPDSGVSTAACYALYDESPSPTATTDSGVEGLKSGDLRALGKALGNALYGPAIRLNESVKMAYGELKEFDPAGVTMTGSGSAVAALFENAEFCAYAKSRYRGKFKAIQLKTVIPGF